MTSLMRQQHRTFFRSASRVLAVALAVALAVVSAPSVDLRAAQSQFYVAPTGRSDGDGSSARPWDLATALAQPVAVKPGDTIWLRGGTYRGAFTSRLTGASGAPIVLRQAPGERAVLDATGSQQATLTIFGQWVTYWGFEVSNSDTQRKTSTSGSWPADISRGTVHGIIVKGPRTKLVNLVVHDAGVGIGFWAEAVDAEIYGNIIFYNGWDGPDRGHGHGIYTQNHIGTKRIVDNIVFQQFGSGLIVYGSERASLNNYVIQGNALFNNGGLSRTSGYARNILLGGGTVAENPVIVDNYTYFAPAPRPGVESLAAYAGARNAIIKRNYFVHASTPQYPSARALQLGNVQGVEMIDNVFQGSILGFTPAQYPENAYHSRSRPARGTRIFVHPNKYEPGRGHIIVYNFDFLNAVHVDLSRLLEPGDEYKILDVQNLFGPAVTRGTYNGRLVSLPMRLTKVAQPVGTVSPLLLHTAPEFAVFLLIKE